VLGYLEWLVAKRVVRKIVYSRLPTGHTHEDIDAMFGVIWRYFREKIFKTLDEYKQGKLMGAVS